MGLSRSNSAPLSSSFCYCMHAFFLLSCCGLLFTFVVGGNNETDRLALLEFKAKIASDPFGAMNSWNDSIHFCQWQGVTCGHRHQRVTVLDLWSLKLVGSTSPHVGNLSFLKILFLGNNSFFNEIPPEIGRLHRLQYFRLPNNTLHGQIPSSLSNCSNLIDIFVNYNLLSGDIPANLGTLSKLQKIGIHNNNLTGSFPNSFGNLSSLEVISAPFNNLGGSIPESFSHLTKLRIFGVSSTRLSGTIPPSIFNLSSIIQFDVGNNQIQGHLPLEIGITLPNIEFFSISGNQFIGSIPGSISNATNLDTLQLNINKLNGKIPSMEELNKMTRFRISGNLLGNGGANDLVFLCSLTNATYLITLQISTNNFGGELPKCIGNFSTNLTQLALDNNKIFGKIPAEVGNLINLLSLDMLQNKLSGNIPYEIGNLQKLQILALNTNNFYGKIPSSIGNLIVLTNLYLYENNLQGNIPLSLSKCQNLFNLNLANNNLSGSISTQVIGLSPIFIFLSSNQFTGVLPMEVGNFENLEILDISKNMLFGKIPASLGSCIKLEYLYMGRNHFQGIIPPSFESLRGLQYLDLSNNNLTGQIPKFLEVFVYLQFLNLSYNHFEGDVPTNRVFKNTSATFLEGNIKLCGGISEFQFPKCKYKKLNKRRLTFTLKLIICILSGVFGVILMLSLLVIFSSSKRQIESTSSNSGKFLLNVSYQSLLKATNGFSSTNLIGVGGFGSVYRGILDQGRYTVAVKVLNLLRHGASKSFITECGALRSVRHWNLVKIVSACSSVDFQGHEFKALVYEFMSNGSLDEWLHPATRTNNVPEKPKSLNLLQRLNIVIDVANALDYLHHHCHTPIIHCDLKPSNVLLDDEMIGHVSDFGLARFLFEDTHDCFTNQSSSIAFRGTMGYAPPEYGMGNEMSILGDVYSYGILLLEMFTGKQPTDNMFKDGLNLHDFVKTALPNQVIDILDPNLLWEREDEMTWMNDSHNQNQIRSPKIQECFILIFGIGVSCSREFARERMNMSDVVNELHSIKEKLLGTRIREVKHLLTGTLSGTESLISDTTARTEEESVKA